MKRYKSIFEEEKKILKERLRGNFPTQKASIEAAYKKIVFKKDIENYFEHLAFVASAELTPVMHGITIVAWRMIFFYKKQIEAIRKKVTLLHEDLQFDYEIELEKLTNSNDVRPH